eukprot:UN01544
MPHENLYPPAPIFFVSPSPPRLFFQLTRAPRPGDKFFHSPVACSGHPPVLHPWFMMITKIGTNY